MQLLDSKLSFYIDKLETRLAKELKDMRTELNVRLSEAEKQTTGFINMAQDKMTDLASRVSLSRSESASYTYVDD